MAHYAKVIEGTVSRIIVAEPEFFDSFVDDIPGEWIKTSYNTFGGVHTLGGTPLRMNFASVGGTYDAENDVFYSRQPYSSWTLDTSTYLWQPPVAMPDDDNNYQWNEETTSWQVIA
jgi:hypothetical protein